jgi:hypothetical protein
MRLHLCPPPHEGNYAFEKVGGAPTVGATGRHFRIPSTLQFHQTVEMFGTEGELVSRESGLITLPRAEIDDGKA